MIPIGGEVGSFFAGVVGGDRGDRGDQGGRGRERFGPGIPKLRRAAR
jgi:hypothetical protein